MSLLVPFSSQVWVTVLYVVYNGVVLSWSYRVIMRDPCALGLPEILGNRTTARRRSYDPAQIWGHPELLEALLELGVVCVPAL